MSHPLVRSLRWVYKKLQVRRLRYFLPFIVLAVYTFIGAYVFRHFELAADEQRRSNYRERTEFAFNRVLAQMMEVRCDEKLNREDRQRQARHSKDALFWLIDYLNLTQVIEERTEHSPWTWMGAMFYAGQLYTTIGYGLPVANTPGGRLASICYIMIGIPIFLLILAEVGKLLSRGLRKLYKRIRTAQQKLPEAATRRMSEPVKAFYNLNQAIYSIGMSFSAAASPTSASERKESQLKEGGKENNDVNNKTDLEANNHVDPQAKPLTNEEKLPPERAKKVDKRAAKGGNFPIPLALCLLIVWIAFSAAMFCLWETEWGYLTSVYFFFVSISTVGLGDIVPTKPDMMFVNFMLILIGLALLSMCINLIQDWMERVIEQLIEEYIDEIEKIAAVVTANEGYERDDEAAEFEVGTAELLTLPVTNLADVNGGEALGEGGRGWSLKDWMAEKIASRVLMNRLDPRRDSDSDSESSPSSSDSEEGSDIETGELHRVEATKPLIHGAASVVVVRHNGEPEEKADQLPKISIHEGTPTTLALPIVNQERQRKPSLNLSAKADIISMTSDRSRHKRKGSDKEKEWEKHRKKHPLRYAAAGALFANYSPQMLRAIQAVEAAKIRQGGAKENDFKSRLFAKFATSDRFTQLVESAPSSLAQPSSSSKGRMVNSSIQTSPSPPPPSNRRKKLRSAFAADRACLLESLDSTNSEVGTNNSTADWTSTSVFDMDSLCSAGYYDISFGAYSTDSVPRLIAEPNTPVNPGPPGGSRNGMPLPFPVSGAANQPVRYVTRPAIYRSISGGGISPPPLIIPTPPPTILIQGGEVAVGEGLEGKISPTESVPEPVPTPTPTTSPTRIHGRKAHSSLPKAALPLLGSVPLHHRALHTGRRFSATSLLPPAVEIAAIHGGKASLPFPLMMSTRKRSMLTAVKTPFDRTNSRTTDEDVKRVEQRVRAACGLLPSDFLLTPANGEKLSRVDWTLKPPASGRLRREDRRPRSMFATGEEIRIKGDGREEGAGHLGGCDDSGYEQSFLSNCSDTVVKTGIGEEAPVRIEENNNGK